LTGFSPGIRSIGNVLNCEIAFQDLEKVLDLALMYKVLNKYKNSTLSQLFIQILIFAVDDSFADVFCIVSHE